MISVQISVQISSDFDSFFNGVYSVRISSLLKIKVGNKYFSEYFFTPSVLSACIYIISILSVLAKSK